MSYDLDALHQKYGIQIASVQFGTTAERSSIPLIAAPAGAEIVLHQVACAASIWSAFRVAIGTGLGTSVWQGYTGNTPLVEGVRCVADASTALLFNATGVGADAGSGFFRVFFTLQKAAGVAVGSL
jgi:hypothetical protein